MNASENLDFHYGVYTRKSSEYEDAQVQSIQRQIDELAELVDRDNLSIESELLKEAQSAFHPGRVEFAKLVQWTSQGKINAWLCWHANRLSRNPVDAGTIVYLMDQGKLHHVRTRDRIYYNTPSDKFMLQMEFTMSKKDSDDKSELVKSGLLRRHRRGYPNGAPPAGYVHRSQERSGHSVWAVDSERFEKIRRVMRKFLAGRDSVTTITRYARDIGLTTRPKNRVGGRALTRSAVHGQLLTNPVYAGRFRGIDGKFYELDVALPRAVTEGEFARIQQMLGDKRATSKKRMNREATYRGLIRGPEGEYVGPDFKFHLVCDCKAKFSYVTKTECPKCGKQLSRLMNPIYRRYTYYSVVKDRIREDRRALSINEKRIDDFVIKELVLPLRISPAIREWALKNLEKLKDEELRQRRQAAREGKNLEELLSRRKARLRELLIDGLVTEDEYRMELRKAEHSYMEEAGEIEPRSDWLEDAKNVVNLAMEAGLIMSEGDTTEKRQALRHLCSNLCWDGKNLSISNAKPTNILMDSLKAAVAKNSMFEPSNWVDTKGSNEVFRDVRPILLRGLDELRTFFQTYPQVIEHRDEPRHPA